MPTALKIGQTDCETDGALRAGSPLASRPAPTGQTPASHAPCGSLVFELPDPRLQVAPLPCLAKLFEDARHVSCFLRREFPLRQPRDNACLNRREIVQVFDVANRQG